MNVLQESRISDRKISYQELSERINETNATTKRLCSAVSDSLSKLGLEANYSLSSCGLLPTNR